MVPLLSCSRSRAICDMERCKGGGGPNDPVPVPASLPVVLLPLSSRGCGGFIEPKPLALVVAVIDRTFSTASTGRGSSLLESRFMSSDFESSLMRLPRVDDSVGFEIERRGSGLGMAGGVLLHGQGYVSE